MTPGRMLIVAAVGDLCTSSGRLLLLLAGVLPDQLCDLRNAVQLVVNHADIVRTLTARMVPGDLGGTGRSDPGDRSQDDLPF